MDVRPGVHSKKENMYLVDDYGPWDIPREHSSPASSIGIDTAKIEKQITMRVLPGLQLLFSPGFSPGSISILYR